MLWIRFKISESLLLTLFLMLVGMITGLNTSAAELSGHVRDSKNNSLMNAHILLLNTSFGTTTDSMGCFHFYNLTEGDYTIHISYLGFETLVAQVNVREDGGNHDFVMLPGTIHLNQGIIVSASRFESQKYSSPFSVSTIGSSELKETFPRSTPEALMSNGAWVQKTNHGGGSPFVRGLTGYHTLLMIDGIRLNNATFRSGPNQYLNTLDPLILSNVEIIRSTGSVQYGSDALGGTVHFFTATPEFSTTGKVLFKPRIISKYVSQGINGIHDSFSKSLFPGMEHIIRGEATIAGKNIAFYGGVGRKKFNDIDASAAIGTLKPNGYDEFAADAKLIIKKEKHRFTTAFQLVKQNDVPLYHKVASGSYSLYEFDPQYRSLTYVKHEFLMGHKWARKINTTLYTHQSIEERHKQNTGVSTGIIESDKVRSNGATIDLLSTPNRFWTFNSGLDLNHDKVRSSRGTGNLETSEFQYSRGLYPDNATQWNVGIFTLHQINLNRFLINTGVRYNIFRLAAADSIFGNTTLTPSAVVGNVGISYEVNEHFRITSMVNTGFRAPNINDISSFGIADFRYEIPSSTLKPERSLSYEIGLRQKSSRISSSLSVFKTDLTNLIINVPATYKGQDSVLINGETNEYIRYYHKENTNKAYIWGFEAETEIQMLKWLNSYGRLYYTFGHDLSKNEPLRRIPPINGCFGLNLFAAEHMHFRTEFLFAGMQDRLSQGDISDDRIPDGGTPGWNTASISAGYSGLPWMDIHMGVNNLFDTAYRIHGSGVDGYGRNIWLGIELNFPE